MAVLPQFGGLAGAQMRALIRDSAAGAQFLSAAVTGNNNNNNNNDAYFQQQYNDNCASGGGAQSELTCNGGGVALPSRKRGREAVGIVEQYVSSSSALLPFPGICNKVVDPGMELASTSGRHAAAADALLVAELGRSYGADEVDALVRAECDRLRVGLEQARKRQRDELARVVVGAAARRLREKEAELVAARRRAVEMEERVRQAAAESQAWQGLARSHEAVAAGLRATLDQLLLRGGGTMFAEGVGENDDAAAADDAQSRCFDAPLDAGVDTAATSPAAKWGCKACGEGEATVLLLPCRHLCLCKSCEPRTDACPACLAVKNASIHVAEN